jgi:hypothetical protein
MKRFKSILVVGFEAIANFEVAGSGIAAPTLGEVPGDV